MTERPILFSGPMVCMILAGRKTQTRRVLKPQPSMPITTLHSPVEGFTGPHWQTENGAEGGRLPCWQGDGLWVREAWQWAPQRFCRCPQGAEPSPCDDWSDGTGCRSNREGVVYRADDGAAAARWRSPIHMPRRASRIALEVTDVRVQRVQEISEADARAEGVKPYVGSTRSPTGVLLRENQGSGHIGPFIDLWNSLNAARGLEWDDNPWVAAITFRQVADG
jgi:hypothetical protein